MANKPFLLLALGLCLFGCQYGPDQQLVGAWSADRLLTKIPDLPIPQGSRRLQNGIYATQLKLSADHTFILTGLRQTGGKWSYSKGVLTLKPAQDSKPGQWGLVSEIHRLKVEPDFSRMTVVIPLPFGQIVIVLDKTA
jgi:hypothetical protein